MMKPKIHPSILCANHGKLLEEITVLEQLGVDYFHIDVMDGHFVPNFGCGTEIVKMIKAHSQVPLDVHLMVEDPGEHIETFYKLGADIITIHAEADRCVHKTLAHIRELGAKSGLSINPRTSVENIENLLPLCDHVLAMTVVPGFGGQSFMESTIEKLKTLGKMSKKLGFSLCVDGGIDAARVQELLPLGVTNFVMGNALFKGDYQAVLSAARGA